MITEHNQFIKENYLNFHNKNSHKFNIKEILINKFIEDDCYTTIDIHNKMSSFTYADNLLIEHSSIVPVSNNDDILLLESHQHNVYNNDNIFTSIISQSLIDDEHIVECHEYSINYTHIDNLLYLKHHSDDFQEFYKYDKHNNLIKVSNDNSTIKYQYNKHNLISKRTEGKFSTIFNYDEHNNINHIQEFKKGKMIQEIFHVYHNNLLTEIHSNGYDCIFSYNQNGLIASIDEFASNHHDITSIEYDHNNHFKYVKYPDGSEEFYSFNDDNILIKLHTPDSIIFENDDISLSLPKSNIIHHSYSIH